MKIFTSSDIKEIDRQTAEKEGITSYELMERAASAVAFEIMSRWIPSQRIVVFAGKGNNGGDALAVARLLADQGYKPIVRLFNIHNDLSPDCEKNKLRLLEYADVDFEEIIKLYDPVELGPDDVVIDGLFGSGLSENLHGGYTSLAANINESGAFVVSIDVPSGLFGEFNYGNVLGSIVHADLTLTFQFPRLAFFFAENAGCIGKWKLLDIGLDTDAMSATPSNYFLIDETGVRDAISPRMQFSSKDDYGRLFLVAGSKGMMGAAVLSARAAMRAGVGAVTVHTPQCGYLVMQTSNPEVMVDEDNDSCYVSEIRNPGRHYTVAIGPGLGTEKKTADALEAFLKQATKPVVLDADALNCIAQRRSMLGDLPANSIITPHAKEFDRLFGEHYSEEERFTMAVKAASANKIVIVLKGRYTKVIRPDGKIFVNVTGNPGMATAGSGDVLTGIIASLLAQGYSSGIAATVGVYIHGLAGDMAREKCGEAGLIASDIVDNIGAAFKKTVENIRQNI